MKEVTDLIEEIVLNINSDIQYDYYTTTSNYVTLYPCDTKWARVGKYIYYVSGTTGVGIEIKEVVENQKIGF
jgi:roadblock/LC7 domain-containing protein